MLNNTQPLFEIMREDQAVDIYQTLISMVVFSKGHFDDKLRTLFTLFDFDGSGEIERKELSCFIQAAVMGLCKLVGLPYPSTLGI